MYEHALQCDDIVILFIMNHTLAIRCKNMVMLNITNKSMILCKFMNNNMYFGQSYQNITIKAVGGKSLFYFNFINVAMRE